MRKLYFGTNTKMFKTIAQTEAYLMQLTALTEDLDRDVSELFVIPSFTALASVGPICRKAGIVLGAQNMGWEDEGPFTGEISPLMLREVGVQLVELGHSERRHILGESDAMVNRKLLCALRNRLLPLLCIGETQEQKQMRLSEQVLRTQLKAALYQASGDAASSLRVAYEPVWAIGESGQAASSDYVAHMVAVIRDELAQLFGAEASLTVPILYGGSVNSANAVSLAHVPQIDGLFIGRSAWDAENFNAIIRSVLMS